MLTAETILALYAERRRFYGDMHSAMRSIKSIYQNDTTVVLPEMDRDEASSVPNLLGQGVDQMAGRIASVTPMPYFVPSDRGVRREVRRAATAGRVVSGWWQQDKLPSKMRFRARHLIAYGMSPTVIRWDKKNSRPTWQVRSPLETYPSLEMIPGTVTPTDTVFAFLRPVSWLRANGFATQVTQVTGDANAQPDTILTLVEYCSASENSLILMGTTNEDSSAAYPSSTQTRGYGPQRVAMLGQVPNRSGLPMATVPSRVSLDTPSGQFDTMTGMYYTQAKLMALEVLAVEKGIFPDTYLESRQGETARFIDGPHDGRTGLVNIVAGGAIREVQAQPSYLAAQTIDRLERNQRVTGGLPAEFGGESGSNIRTGRRGDAVMSSTIDFPIAEAQDVFAQALIEENKAAIALAKHHSGMAKRTIYVGTGNSASAVTFVANEVFTSDEHNVSYPITGTDLNGTLIGIGQRVGMGTMSKQTAAALDPFIDSPEFEHDQIIAEGLEQALVAGIQQQANSGQIPPQVVGQIIRLVATDRMELAEAINKVTEDAAKAAAKEAEAASAAQPGETPLPPDAATLAAPAAQQSLAGAAPPTMPGATEGQQTMSDLLSTLRRPVMAVSNNAGAPGKV